MKVIDTLRKRDAPERETSFHFCNGHKFAQTCQMFYTEGK